MVNKDELIVLISGIPASGKTTISNLLAAKHNVFLTVEETDIVRAALLGEQDNLIKNNILIPDNLTIIGHGIILEYDDFLKQNSLYLEPIYQIIKRQKRKKIPSIINGMHIMLKEADVLLELENIHYFYLYFSSFEDYKNRLMARKSDVDLSFYLDVMFENNKKYYEFLCSLKEKYHNIHIVDVGKITIDALEKYIDSILF